MNANVECSKKAEITIRMSGFEMPPMQDVIIIWINYFLLAH